MVRPPRPASRPALLLAGLLALASGVTCTDSTGPKRVHALVGIAPVFSTAATQIYHKLVSFELALDNVHVRLERANGEVAVDTTVAIAPGQREIVLRLSVVIDGQAEDFKATIELREGTQVLFAGTQIVTARVGVTSTPPPPVVVEYTGPGSTVTVLDVQPDTTISGAQSIAMRTVALDANNQPVTDLALLWSLGDAGTVSPLGSISQEGVFTPTGVRGSVVVNAELPTGIRGSATVNIVPPANALSLVSGGGQTGVVGSVLAPIMVEVLATDGLPVVGHPISFVVTSGGGAVVPPSAVTDGAGRATAMLTLGATPGVNSIEITAAGLAPITVSATATPIPSVATTLAFTHQPPNGAAGVVLGSPIVVEVRDQFGNRVTTGAGATADISLALVDGTLTGTTSVAAVAGVATFNALTVVSPGTHRLVATSTGLTSATSNPFSIAAAGTGTIRTWTGGSGDFAWETAGNWSGGVAPGATDTAVINTGETSVTISSPVSVGKVVLGGETGSQGLLVLGPTGSLSVSDSLRVAQSGALILQGDVAGTVLSGGRVLIEGHAQWVFGAVTGSNPIVVGESGVFVMVTTAGLNLGRTLENHGHVLLATGGGGNLTLSNGASIENSNEFQTQGTLGIVQGSGAAGSFLNFGTFRRVIGEAGTTTIGVAYSNSGNTEVQQGIINFTGPTLTNTTTGVLRGNGSLDVDVATFANAGTLSPGLSAGELEVFGALPMQGTSRLVIEIGGTAQASEYDFLSVDGAVSLSGTLDVSLINGFQPQVGQTFQVMEFSSRTGTFANIIGLNLGGGLELVPQFSSTGLTLVVQASAAATISWTNAAGGAWNTASNWNLNRVPNSSDIVGIELDGTYTVTLETDVSYTFAGLILGGSSGTQTLSGDLNTLIINGNTTISPHGALNLVGSTIAGTGTVTNRSTVALQNTTVSATTAWSNQGTVYVHGTVTFNGIVVTAVGSAFLVQGQASTGNALLTVASGFTNNGVIDLLSSQESGAHMAVTNGTLINMAMISSAFGQDGGPRTLAAHLDNRGLLFVETPLTVNTPAAPLTNSGSIDLLQNLTVNGDFAQTATGLLSTRIGEGSQLSTLAVTGTAALGGTLHATLADGFVPVVENSFAPVFYEGVTGTFATFSLPALGAGLAWTTTVGGAQVNLRVDATTGSVVSWNNPAGGNWNNPSNWSPARVPTASDVAAITLSGDYTVTLDVSTEVAGLDLGSGTGVRTFTALSRILTVNGPINVFSGGVLSLTSSTLNGTGSLTNQGTVVLVHGTIQTILNNDGLLLAQGSSFLQNNVTTTQQSIIRAQGQNSTGDAFLTVAGGFFNLGVIELTSVTAASAARLAVTTGTLVNNEQALIRSFVGAGGERSLIAALDNLGVLHVDQPLVMNRASSQHSNSGLIDLTGADLTVAQSGSAPSFSNIGQITIGNNRTFTIAGGTFVQQAGATLNGAGTFIQNLGTATFNTGVTLVGLNLTAMTLNLGSGVNLSVSGPTVSLLSTTVNGPGIITIGAGQTLLMTGTNITASSALDNQGTVVVNGGSQVNGALLSSTGSVIRMQADATTNFAQMTVPNTGFVNNGAIELTSSVNAIAQLLANSGGTFTNGTSGTITTFGGAGGLRFLGAMNNQGTVTVRPGANSSGILHFSGNLTNSGVVNLEIGGTTAGDGHGQVTVNGTASLGGTLNVALVNGFVPAVNDVFTIMTCATSCAGGFTTLNLPALGTGLAWSPAVNATTVTLTVVATGGATVSWINPAGGLWSERTNWSTGVVPSSTDVVGITLAGTYGVNVDAAPTIAGLILGNATGNQTFGATSRVVTINGPISVVSGGQLHLTGSTLNGTGSVTNQGNIELINSTVTNIVDNQGVLIAYGSTTSLNNTITNTGTLRVLGHSIAGEANLTVLQGFTNNGMIDLNSVTGHSAQLTVTNGTLTNAIEGVIQSSVGAGGQRTIDAQLDNQGILDINLVLTLNRSTSAQHRNSGTIEINGNFTVGQSITGTTFTNTGNVTLSAGPVWTINGGTLDLAGGLVSGSPFSQVILNTATLAFTPARITAPLTLNSTAISGGAIVVGEGDVLTLEGGGTTAPITIANAGTLVIHRAVALTSIANIQNGGTLIVQGHGGFDAALTVANGFTNNGNIELTSATGHGASLTVTNGTLVNAAGANFVSSVGAGGTRVLAAQLQNAGVVDVQHALDISRAEADHENNGSIRLTDGNGNLTVTQSGSSPTFTNNGSMDLGAGRAVNISGGHLAFAEGAVTGTPTSTLIVNNAQLDFSATTTVPLTLTNTTISGGSLTILAGREVTLLGGGLTDPVNLAGGTLITGRTVTLTSLAISGGVLRVEGGHGGFPADLQVANPVVNNGQIQLTSSSGHASTLTVNGTLTNSSTGVINVLQGAGGGRTLAATLDNQGQINAGIALDINRVDARHVNTGTINFTLGIQTLTQTGTDPRFTNAGTIALTSNSVWNVSGGLFDVDQGIITGSSANNLQVTNAVIAFTPATIALPLTLVNTSVEAGAVTVASGQTLTLEGGAVPVPITVQNTGVLVAHRTLALTDVSTEPGGTLRVEGGSGSFPAAVTVANPVNNAGIIELTSLSGHDSRLDVSSGTLTNSGTILSDIGSGGARILGAELENQNLVQVRQPLALSRSGAAHRNFGTIDLTTADLTVAGAASFTNTSDGLVSLGADRRWTVSGGSLDLNSGIVTGPTSATLVLSGATLTYTVASLTLPISVHNGGNMSPNGLSILGLLNLNGSYSQTASGVLNIELRGTTLLEYDRVSIRENATLDGTLSVTTLNDFVPQVDDSFTILSAASISGNFGTTNLPPSAGIWQVNIGSTTVVITVTRP